jgi:acid phosphatase
VSFVVPNLVNDMHTVAEASALMPRSEAIAREVAQGDAWLKAHLADYAQWARTHNSLLIVTFDENENTNGMHALTDPASSEKPRRNHIVTLLYGAHVRPGQYPEGKGITHVNLLRTLEAMYGLARSGAQQPEALQAGIQDDTIVTDVFEAVKR